MTRRHPSPLRFFLTVVAVLMLASPAAAQPAEPTTADGWLDQLDALIAELDTADCAVACAALESMRRAADEVCKLDDGPPCAQAREKVETARQKVAEACPDCEAAKKSASVTPKPGAAPRPPPTPPTLPERAGGDKIVMEQPGSPAPQPASPPPADDAGGCATCTVGRARDDADVWWLVAGVALAVARRRRITAR